VRYRLKHQPYFSPVGKSFKNLPSYDLNKKLEIHSRILIFWALGQLFMNFLGMKVTNFKKKFSTRYTVAKIRKNFVIVKIIPYVSCLYLGKLKRCILDFLCKELAHMCYCMVQIWTAPYVSKQIYIGWNFKKMTKMCVFVTFQPKITQNMPTSIFNFFTSTYRANFPLSEKLKFGGGFFRITEKIVETYTLLLLWNRFINIVYTRTSINELLILSQPNGI